MPFCILDGLKQSKSTKWASNCASRWKAAVHSIANKVAQVSNLSTDDDELFVWFYELITSY